MNLKQLFIFLIPMLMNVNIQAQENITGYTFLNYVDSIPSNLLDTRTVVIIDVPDKRSTGTRNNWKELAQVAHTSLGIIGIDATIYMHYDDLFSGYESQRAFARYLYDRDIQNVIFLKHLYDYGTGKQQFVMVVTPFNKKVSVISQGQSAWRMQLDDLDDMLNSFYKYVAMNISEGSNNLIAEVPEFYADVAIIKGKKQKSLSTDLKKSKIAVPLFEKRRIPSDIPTDPVNQIALDDVEAWNSSVELKNSELKSICANYSYNIEFVNFSHGLDSIKGRRIDYVMMWMHTNGKTIKGLLDYQVEENETEYVTLKHLAEGTVLKRIPVDADVYKFYIKRLYNNDVFLGEDWDADLSWQDALRNYLDHMKKELGQ